jgi:two-component sensor histidine kinase
MMTLYEKLYLDEAGRGVSLAAFLPTLVEEIASVFPRKGNIKVETDIEDVVLDPKTLSTLGIILNELVTNSMKYAFAGRSGGTIRVRTLREGSDFRLVYSDDGIGIEDEKVLEHSSGFGLTLIRALSDQLGGVARLDLKNGTNFELSIKARSSRDSDRG